MLIYIYAVYLFGEVSVEGFDPFCNWLFVFLLSSFKSSLCVLNNNSLSDVSFANIFSLSVACFHILLKFCAFCGTEIFNLMESSLSTSSFPGCAFGVIFYLKVFAICKV